MMKKVLCLTLLILINFSIFSQVNNLIGYYPFNGNANDYSGNGYHPDTIVGASVATDTICPRSLSYTFDGIDDYIAVTPDTLIDFLDSSFAIAFWMKADNIVSNWFSLFKTINNAGSGFAMGTDLHRDGLNTVIGNIDFILRDDTGKRLKFTLYMPQLFDNKWHHFVYNIKDVSTSNYEVYVDNVPVTATTNYAENPSAFSGFDHSIALGAANNRGTIETYFKGNIDDFRIYNRSLNASEISAISQPAPLAVSYVVQDDSTQSCDVSISLNSSGGVSPYYYQWDDPGNQTTSIATGLCSGTYNVTATDANACDTVLIIVLDDNFVSGFTNSFFSSQLVIFPNPANESFFVSVDQMEGVELRLINMAGQTLSCSSIVHSNNVIQMDVSSFPKGIYILHIISAEGIIIKKMILQ